MLKEAWDITNDTDFNFYGRAYRNQSDDGYSPEVFIKGKEYKEVYFDDNLKALAFFGVDERQIQDGTSTTVKVWLIFSVKVDKLKPEVAWRADEEIQQDVRNILASDRYGFTPKAFCTGIDNVYKEYSGVRKADGIKYKNMQPLLCFRIDFELLYNAFNICS